ncbi:MAG TPA: GMC family oxidoreductase [Candidatus Margulisiibacteriota bacterium]|nr:GMC family oxidoreductase [Candidatus Margulisiibacteriota bacterium]
MILDTTTVDRDVSLSADVCIVGSGAGGAVVARELAERGRSVVVVEEGPYLTHADFTQREDQMVPRLYADQGGRATVDTTALIFQGCVLGGSTVPSYCVCERTPRQILAHWSTALGVPGVRPESMVPFFARIEATANVRSLAADDLSKNSRQLKIGADRLGFRNHLPAHNRVDCLGCGYCALGCAYDRKADALSVYLPAASRRGAIIVPDCRVERVTVTGGQAAGVTGRFLRSRGGRSCALQVRAARVVLAAGAIGSPVLWLRSQLPNTYRQVGRNLHLHPMVAVGALFSEEIAGWRGIPQAVIVDQFLDLDHAVEGGYLIHPFFAHPIATAALLPGFGADCRQLMQAYPRLGLAAVMLHDRTTGRVELDASGRPSISYLLGDEDRNDLLDGMRRLADIHFAAGAERVILPYDPLVELTRRGDYRAIDERPLRANDPLLFSYHPQGTMRMGSDPKRSVVNGIGETHEVKRLFVADASIFPTSTAVPPQLSVMAFALRTAQHIAEGS